MMDEKTKKPNHFNGISKVFSSAFTVCKVQELAVFSQKNPWPVLNYSKISYTIF